jgi:hypothetical protein
MTILRSGARRAHTAVLAGILSIASVPAIAQTRAERLSDKDVKALIDEVDKGRDKFEGNLDGEFKGSTLRGPAGETKVSGALQDYQDNTKKLQDRFSSEYAASAEVATVLKQSTLIDAFMQRSSSAMKGRSEWDRQVTNLKHLAAAYGTTFPFTDGATVRRMNDKETAAVADEIGEAAERLKGDIDRSSTLAKADKGAVKQEADRVEKLADEVESRAADGKPASGEVLQLVEQVTRLATFLDANERASVANWQSVQTSLATLQQAFGLKP